MRGWIEGMVLTLALLLAGCGGPFEVAVESPLPEGVRPLGIVIFPVAGNLHGNRALESIARAGDAARWLLRRTELPLMGPLDYKLFREVDEIRVASTGTDLVTRDRAPVDLKGWLSLQMLITENRATHVRDILDMRKGSKTEGKTFRQYGVEAALTVEVQLFDAMRGRRRGRVIVRGNDDPSQARQEGEPRPVVAKLIDLALTRLFALVMPSLQGPPRRRVRGDGFVPSVPKMAHYTPAGLPAYMDKFKGKDETDRQAIMLSLWDRFQTKLSVRATYAATRHPGLLVHTPRAPLVANDVILAIGGDPIYTAWQLDRHLRACGMAGCEATVWRGLKEVKLHIAWPAVPRPEPEEG